MQMLWSVQKKMNVQTIFSPYYKHWFDTLPNPLLTLIPVLAVLAPQPYLPVRNKHKYDHQIMQQKSCQGYEDTSH